ncbi:Os01g0149600, partial [Oryza sativa Japonica Group]
ALRRRKAQTLKTPPPPRGGKPAPPPSSVPAHIFSASHPPIFFRHPTSHIHPRHRSAPRAFHQSGRTSPPLQNHLPTSPPFPTPQSRESHRFRFLSSPREEESSGSHGAQGGEEAGREEARGGGARSGEGREGPRGEEAQGGEASPRRQGREGQRRGEEGGEEEGEEERRDLQDLHLQGAQAGSPRHRHLLQGHVLPGELAKHAVSEGTKAVTKFTSA